jgi:hypothetical protein
LGGGNIDAALERPNVQLAINTAALGAVRFLRGTPGLRLYRAECLAIGVVRIDEGFVELEPDALALGAPR